MGYSNVVIGAAVAAAALATEGKAAPIPSTEQIPQTSVLYLQPILAWFEDETIWFGRPGETAQQLVFQNTPEMIRLRELLTGATRDAPAVIPESIILVGGGGCGTPLTPYSDKGRDNGPPGDGSEGQAPK